MKRLFIILTLATLSSCASTKNSQSSLYTEDCIAIANNATKNDVNSGDDLFKQCLEDKHQKRNEDNSLLENSLEGLLHFVLDIIAS